MTTARQAASPASTRQRVRVERRRSLRDERRLVRQELLAVLFLLVALLVTVLLLALQWLDGGSSSIALAPHLAPTHGGPT